MNKDNIYHFENKVNNKSWKLTQFNKYNIKIATALIIDAHFKVKDIPNRPVIIKVCRSSGSMQAPFQEFHRAAGFLDPCRGKVFQTTLQSC